MRQGLSRQICHLYVNNPKLLCNRRLNLTARGLPQSRRILRKQHASYPPQKAEGPSPAPVGTSACPKTSDELTPEEKQRLATRAIMIGVGIGFVLAYSANSILAAVGYPSESDATATYSTDTSLSNWSGTHTIEPKRLYEPSSTSDLVKLVAAAHSKGQQLRPVGTALSPNGIAMAEDGMVSLAQLDRITKIDKEKQLVKVEAGARVSQVLQALAQEGMTLGNFSSITEQQMGGWTQVAAHGTGARLPTVEEQIVRLKLVTPAYGVMRLSEEEDPELFRVAKVGLGALGIVSELTLKAIPRHDLLERTYVATAKQLRKDHHRLLTTYRHLRYMWLPYTDKVVVVHSNPHQPNDPLPSDFDDVNQKRPSEEKRLSQCRKLLARHSKNKLTKENIASLGFTELRDHLLDLAPLDTRHIAVVNAAEAQYWTMNSGYRVEDSEKVLGFDCGGQQWVLEVAFPIGPISMQGEQRSPDLDFVEKILSKIRDLKLPAPCPIEQRWTAASTSIMSPAHSTNSEDVFSWVGIIMYIPSGQGPEGREAIRQAFQEYVRALDPIFKEYKAVPHWAKLEIPEGAGGEDRLKHLRARLGERYALDQFNLVRKGLDTKEILSNPWLKALFD